MFNIDSTCQNIPVYSGDNISIPLFSRLYNKPHIVLKMCVFRDNWFIWSECPDCGITKFYESVVAGASGSHPQHILGPFP